MKGSTVRKALESDTPLNSLYALIPEKPPCGSRPLRALLRAESGKAARGVGEGKKINNKSPVTPHSEQPGIMLFDNLILACRQFSRKDSIATSN